MVSLSRFLVILSFGNEIFVTIRRYLWAVDLSEKIVGWDNICSFSWSSIFQVCERSLSGSGAGPSPAAAAQFVRAEMLPSGYLIRPCEGGGSIIHIVDHLNLEVCLAFSPRSFYSGKARSLDCNIAPLIGVECS